MNKIKIILFTIILFIVLTGCESTYYLNNEETLKNQTDRFIIIKEWTDERERINYIAYDRETTVEYWIIDGSYVNGMTVLLDSEGKPILYKEGKDE